MHLYTNINKSCIKWSLQMKNHCRFHMITRAQKVKGEDMETIYYYIYCKYWMQSPYHQYRFIFNHHFKPKRVRRKLRLAYNKERRDAK